VAIQLQRRNYTVAKQILEKKLERAAKSGVLSLAGALKAAGRNPPPVLYSIPGSGNTMTRLLIDGVLEPYHSGAVYRDGRLFKSLPGEV